MTAADPMTSVPVHTSTLRFLQEFKTGAQNWDAFFLELVGREMDRDDLAYARSVLEKYRAGRVSEHPRKSARRHRSV